MSSQRSGTESKRVLLPACIFAIALSVCLLFPSLPLNAAKSVRTIDAVVTRVIDGDTVHVLTHNGTKLKVRLYGIDAPEFARAGRPGQPFAEESRKHLSSMVLGKKVRLDIWEVDRYRRMVALIWLDGRNINLEMIEEGLAEAYPEYLRQEPYRRQFLMEEAAAKEKKAGIWSLGEKYERPSDYKARLAARRN